MKDQETAQQRQIIIKLFDQIKEANNISGLSAKETAVGKRAPQNVSNNRKA